MVFYWVLLGFSKFLIFFTGFLRTYLVFYGFEMGSTRFYRVLLDFYGFL